MTKTCRWCGAEFGAMEKDTDEVCFNCEQIVLDIIRKDEEYSHD